MSNDPLTERRTGELYGRLWPAYDSQLFQQSIDLFARRLELADFDKNRIIGKRCLDAGCGGGRNSIALSQIGADSVAGIDIGVDGLKDAQTRARSIGTTNVEFLESSVLDIPFDSEEFDFIWCAGVIMHTVDPDKALRELFRVLKPGGYLYLLVYATEGLRWPMVQLLRPIASLIGEASISLAIDSAGLQANKRRTYLDDLFVPAIDFFTWPRLVSLLERTGFNSIQRWGPEARLDHEASLNEYRADLAGFKELFAAGKRNNSGDIDTQLHGRCTDIVDELLAMVDSVISAVESETLSEEKAMETVIGQGHHRVVVRKPD